MAVTPDAGSADPVSFTDTNAETGAAGKGTAGTSSNMMELVGQLKKGKTTDSANVKNSKGGKRGKKDKKKKKKSTTKTKTKYKRRHDRYEPENYLLRIEGSICCGFLIAVVLFLLYNAMILLIVIIWTHGVVDHLHNKEPLQSPTATPAPPVASG